MTPGDRWQRRRAELALTESESRLRRVFDDVNDALFVTDQTDRVLDANAAALALTSQGLSSLQARSFGQLLSAAVTSSSSNVPSAHPPAGEYRLVRPDGTVRAIDVRSSRLAADLTLYTVRDLTVQRGLEAQLNQAQKMEAVGRLAGGVAHDFNNMLTAILAYGELLAARIPPGSAGREEAEEIIKAARRAAQLTAQLLAFGRKSVLRPRVIDLVESLADTEKMLKRLMGDDVVVVTRTDGRVPSVRADPGQLDQVVMNLAVNARDAMPHGGTMTLATARVDLSAERPHAHGTIPAGTYAVLDVTDSGTGMDQATLARLFEPFFTTKEQGKGTGLGLSTSYGIVSQSGGYIEVDSAAGAGSTFRVYLPATSDDVGSPASVMPTPAREMPTPRAGAGTILLVEDETGVRELVERILRRAGFSVLPAENGRGGLELADQHSETIDLVITDIEMPGMAGPELVRRLHARLPNVAVLYMSGYSLNVTDSAGLVVDGNRLLQKPFTAAGLLQAVSTALGLPAEHPAAEDHRSER